MTESTGINIVGKGQGTGHEDSGVFESPSSELSPAASAPEHINIRTPLSLVPIIPDRTSPRGHLAFSFHGYPPRPSAHDTTRFTMGQHPGFSMDADRSFEGDVNILFEDSGSYCPSIPEDSEEEGEEGEDPGYQRPIFEIPSSPSLSSGDFNSYMTQPMAIPSVQGRSFDRSPAGTDADISSGSRHSVDNVTSSTNNTPANHCSIQGHGQGTNQIPKRSGGLSLSPVIESMLLQKMRNRLSGDFEERSLRVSGCLLANDSDFRERASSVSGQPPDAQIVRAARMSRGRSQSAPTVEANLIVQRQQVGGALRLFGDQFNREYERRAPTRSPNQRQSLRRQVLSCPTQHSLWQQMLLEKIP